VCSSPRSRAALGPAAGARLRARTPRGIAAPGLRTSAAPASRPKGAKRPASELVDLRDRLREHVAGNPGQRVEQINAALGTATREVARPLRQLVASGALRTEGIKRATTYHPSGEARAARGTVSSAAAVAPRRRRRAR